ncbi:peptidoglycan/xylan/chitin deacetylase (PgdA/CDA1 family) [Novosphingobium sp. SG751A]|uniref:polysaccharide deacetylase family protein n=1 Tax=Novosphingobium sp. SG751A TaxID=2587000 RepID=UPI00155591E5|nr:polysaccharide deacetylase [Novosphingobium sp. SG751A]NOW44959.1 peptidoglycan/xylan/chitin deacetylase (PgdA/CDA1 family) [Novosphingobium sp. SG751A]
MYNADALAGVPLKPANAADLAPDFPWPPPFRAAMFLSFDVDAESAWTGDDADTAKLLISMSYGGYEARIGTRKLLELLADLELKATFFIPGWTVEAHPMMCEAIAKDGHEIGHHGYHHLMPHPDNSLLVEEVERGLEALQRVLGVRPKGYRAPSGEFTAELLALLQECNFLYTSSFRDDVRPYRHRLADGRAGTIELPVSAGFDDWSLGLQTRTSSRQIMSTRDVLPMWMDELDEVRDWGAMLTTVLHPQCSGRPNRFRLLRTFLQQAMAYKDVWITTGEAIADRFREHERLTGA